MPSAALSWTLAIGIVEHVRDSLDLGARIVAPPFKREDGERISWSKIDDDEFQEEALVGIGIRMMVFHETGGICLKSTHDDEFM